MRGGDDEFRANLALGRQWETAVASWLLSRGWRLMPDYAGDNTAGAPKLRGGKEGTVLPDILGAERGAMKYVEVKYRSRSVDFHLIGQRVTGKIEERLWNEYLRIEQDTGIPVWLVFVQRAERELVGAPLKHIARFSHRGVGDGAGFLYIEYECLDRLASFADIDRFIDHGPRCACAECFASRSPVPAPTKCKLCGTPGQTTDINAPAFIGPGHGLCVPCFRREWAAERTPAWRRAVGGHGPTCACSTCFAQKLR